MQSILAQYLDTEARVDNDDVSDQDSEEERDLNDAFLDDGSGSEDNQDTSHLAIDLSPSSNVREDALDRLIERIMAASSTSTTRRRDTNHELRDEVGATTEMVICLPREDDFPLWKVSCRVGTEEIAVLSLMETAASRHELRSAFTRGSIRGSIYLESTMNNELVNLLRKTPGILCSRHGVQRRMLESSENVDMLRMKDCSVEAEVGDWVRVKKGLYRGDVGIVHSVNNWGVHLLLLPRIDWAPSLQSRKRKATVIRPPQKLFEPADEQRQRFSAKITRKGENLYSMGRSRFEHGLLAKKFDFHSFSKDVKDIPYTSHAMFVQSKHPRVAPSRMPRPLEWLFRENENVILLPNGELAEVKSMEVFYAEVEQTKAIYNPWLELVTWTESVAWKDIRKDIKVGQYVRINSGPRIGITGWVVEVKDEVATLAVKVKEGTITQHDQAIEFVDFHVNCSDILESPVTHQSLLLDLQKQNPEPPIDGVIQPCETGNPLTEKARRHPWCGLHVMISKKSHPKKGETGEVKEVTGRCDGTGPIKLSIQLTRYNPSAPFQTITVDYDDIVESRTLRKLVEVINPSSNFCCPQVKPKRDDDSKKTQPQPSPSNESKTSGSQTPMPTSTDYSETPAWNPLSKSPIPADVASRSPRWPYRPLTPPNPSKEQVDLPTHVLLNPRLAGVSLNVVANGGEYIRKELVATIFMADDGVASRPVLRHVKYHTSVLLDPEWITPKYPNPTHDNGLLVVIKGEHCGKYVRRIHHRRENGFISILLAVVTRSDNQPDVLTGEQLELGIEFLSTVLESKKQKDLNRNIMQKTREQFRTRNT